MFNSIQAKNAAANAVTHLVDSTSLWPSGGIYLYDTTNIPFNNPDTTSPTPIVRLPLSYPSFMSAVDGTSVAYLIHDATAFRDGTTSAFGVFSGDSTLIWGGTVSNMFGIGDMKLNQPIIEQDQTVSLTSGIYVVP